MSTTPAFPAASHVTVAPFSRQAQGEEVIIGRPETGVFLAIPASAVEVLDDLALGLTIGEAQERFRSRHGKVPDLEDFLGYLATAGLVRTGAAGDTMAAGPDPRTAAAEPSPIRFHFRSMPQRWARRLFNRWTLGATIVLVALAALALVQDRALVPRRQWLYLPGNASLYLILLLLWSMVSIFLHEMAHSIAARAVGVDSRLGIGNRLWFLVAEADLTDLWSVAPRQRFLPILAGPLADLVSDAALVLLLAAQGRGWLQISLAWTAWIRAVVVGYLLRLLWQCFLFVRTDFYYALINLTGCVNLMKNTEHFLRNQLARLMPRFGVVDLSRVPRKEMLMVHLYAPAYLAGRALAFWMLLFVTLPVTWHYLAGLLGIMAHGLTSNPVNFVEAGVVLALAYVPAVAGMYLWLRSFARKWRLAR